MRVTAIHTPSAAAIGKYKVPGFLLRVLAYLQAARMRRAVLAELHGLDERTLADLRLSPGDFPAIAEGSYIREGGAHDVALKAAPEASAKTGPRRTYY